MRHEPEIKPADCQALGSPKRVTSPAPAPVKPPEQVSPGVYRCDDGRMFTGPVIPAPAKSSAWPESVCIDHQAWIAACTGE